MKTFSHNTLKIRDSDNSWDTLPAIVGTPGNGIKKIEKTNSQDGIDTYTITFTNGDTFDYQLRNGSISNIEIGDNGNWFINGDDTGQPSMGKIDSITSTEIDEIMKGV